MCLKTRLFLGPGVPLSRRKDAFKEKMADRGRPARDEQCIHLTIDNNTLRSGKLNPGQKPIELLDLNEGQVQRNVISRQLTPITLSQVLFVIPVTQRR
jgi:hypothetical protein